MNKLVEWKNRGGVLLIGYEMFRTIVTNAKTAKQMKNQKKLSFGSGGEQLVDLEEEDSNLAKLNGKK